MDLIKSSDSKYEEYERLLLERDQVNKEAGQIWTTYLSEFGALITENYEEKLECVKCKKIIAYYQNALNHGGEIDSAAMQEYMDREMASYYSNLDRLIKDSEVARKAGKSTPYEVKRAKELYRRLAKLIHPDINPKTDRSDELQELWQRIMTAYHMNHVKELGELEVLVRRLLKEMGTGDVKVEIPDIDDKTEELRREIDTIRNTEPYTLRHILEDEHAAEKKKTDLREETESFRSYRKELEAVILQMLQSGGLKIYVQ